MEITDLSFKILIPHEYLKAFPGFIANLWVILIVCSFPGSGLTLARVKEPGWFIALETKGMFWPPFCFRLMCSGQQSTESLRFPTHTYKDTNK
jgi:hypothetical protein